VRPYQAATAAIFILIAAVAMFDTRAGALPDPTGIAPGGLRGGWYPFWSAAIVAVAALYVLVQALTTPQDAQGAFQGRAAVYDVGRFVLPMVAATFLMQEKWLGFYMGSGLFVAYYAGLTARYRWYWAVLAGVGIPLVLFLIFEVGFRAVFPKSFLYPGLPF
jgi:hypothetical protein